MENLHNTFVLDSSGVDQACAPPRGIPKDDVLGKGQKCGKQRSFWELSIRCYNTSLKSVSS